ncbi:BON domain-containing protein [Lacisediminihabitans profunda]|uniref:BON domain-containing protein n=1 Tax=Lacisediminihabitans profunda TaxID=2594790 RepID=A0A5C8UUB1_9MICO|nr:BON domain-containing protein [Lacisediminihabitans profunda]TXN31896.1 BON domain-containing protein [Lacisediminihabitans profunda]
MNTSPNSPSNDDLTVKEEVEEELLWNPEVDPARIGVSVHDGVVTLTGEVRTFAERIAATEAAMAVRGVLSVADDLTVDLADEAAQSDTHVAHAVLDALARDTAIPAGAITVEVRDGTVTLKGEVEWNHQREGARRDVEHLPGVRFLDSRIELSRRPSASDTEERIRRAIVRNAQLDASHIHVSIDGTVATITGEVRSWAEKRQASLSAWRSPHVTSVHNEIKVKPSY